jgi:integrase
MTEQGKPKRPKGTGSVYVRDGVVIGQYEVRTPDGEIRRRYVRGKDKKEVAGRLAKAMADRDSGLVYDSGKASVGEYLDGWLDAIRGSLRERTWRRHEEIARIHLKPSLGKTRLDALNALQVQSLYRRKLDSGLSPRTVQMVHLTLHKALKQAVRWMLMPRNVAEAVDPPRPATKEIRPLDAEQVKKLLVIIHARSQLIVVCARQAVHQEPFKWVPNACMRGGNGFWGRFSGLREHLSVLHR